MGMSSGLCGFWFLFYFVFLMAGLPSNLLCQDQAADESVENAVEHVLDGMPSDDALTERLDMLQACMPLRITPTVKRYIHSYVVHRTEKSKTMLGRRLTYFPMFEQVLKAHGLPTDLKHLAVVESALVPDAVSRSGAVGLWQFMPATGEEYGLQMSTAVNGRVDPLRSTEAAARYLKNLYRMYDDWALALAAYNSGPGRVNAAIRRARSRNFWRIQAFLPQETRNYVPAFIAASYICNYHLLHGLEPDYPDRDEQLIAHMKVFETLTFHEIAEATGVRYSIIQQLNPGFRRDYIPEYPNGHHLILPERVMPAFVRYMNSRGGTHYNWESIQALPSNNLSGDGRYARLTVQVEQGAHIDVVADNLQCSADHLKAWNQLSYNYVAAGQVLTLWRPVFIQTFQRVSAAARAIQQEKTPRAPILILKPLGDSIRNQDLFRRDACDLELPVHQLTSAPKCVWYTLRKKESLDEVARLFDVTPEQIRALNPGVSFRKGARLRIQVN